VRVWRARGIPNPVLWLAKEIGILRAAATRENDKRRIQQYQNRHYDMQDPIGAGSPTEMGYLTCKPFIASFNSLTQVAQEEYRDDRL